MGEGTVVFFFVIKQTYGEVELADFVICPLDRSLNDSLFFVQALKVKPVIDLRNKYEEFMMIAS